MPKKTFMVTVLNWRPEVLIFTLLLGISYAVITGPLGKNLLQRESYVAPSRSEVSALSALLLVFAVATGTPIDILAQTSSFIFYIGQMLLMTMVMPWLLLLSIPTWLMESLLSVPRVRKLFIFMTNPWIASLSYNAVATLSLLPRVLDLNLTTNWIHLIIQTGIMLSAVFFWWPFVNRSKTIKRIDGLYEFFYILYSIVLMLPIIIILLITRTTWYTVYPQSGSTAMQIIIAQQDGAKVMLIGMLFVFGALGLRILRHIDRAFWYNTPS